RAQLEDAYAAVEGAEGLVDHVGRLSREQDLARKPIVLHPVINEAVKQLKEIAPKGVTVNADVDTDCGHVMADGARVLQAVLNLGRNAIEAVGDSGQVDIELKLREITPELAELSPRLDPQRSYVVIRVKDNGVGMSTATQARAFEPFYSRGDAKGAGLGLAVVRGIVLAHDGEILLDSEPGEGTTIEILLPPSITGIVASEEAQDDWRGDAHVLVVDSDKDTADSIAEALKALGYRVTSRTNASDAIAAFQALADDVSVAIVSQDLEPIPGAELAETLRRINVDLAVILTADFGQEPTDEELARVGAVGKLKKPVIGNDLAKIVKMAVTSREA
ncbi:response regulator, partial [bacterium]|nr:response regulator [bacterium]